MTKIYLVRHGSTEWNEKRIWQGVVDTELSTNGIEEVEKMAEFFKNKQVDVIFSSPMRRAYQTANIIASKTAYGSEEIIVDNRLRECEIKLWNGKTNEEIDQLYAAQFHEWFTNLSSDVSGVESLESVQRRMYDFLKDVIVHFTNKNVIIVSHAIALRMLISKILNLMPPDHLNFALDNASVSSLISNDGRVKVNFLNYTCDL